MNEFELIFNREIQEKTYKERYIKIQIGRRIYGRTSMVENTPKNIHEGHIKKDKHLVKNKEKHTKRDTKTR